MPFILLLLGLIILVAAVRDTHVQLMSELSTDAAGYGKWALAIGGVGALGFVPGLQTLSRGLVALVLLVLVLGNYVNALKGFKASATPAGSGTPATPSPAAAYQANPSAPAIVNVSDASAAPGNVNATQTAQAVVSPFGQFDPQTLLTSFEQQALRGFGG